MTGRSASDDQIADTDLPPIPRRGGAEPPGVEPDAPDDPCDGLVEEVFPFAAAASSLSGPCVTFSCWLAIGPFTQLNDTSMAILKRSASSSH
jgi:hypothetical protein